MWGSRGENPKSENLFRLRKESMMAGKGYDYDLVERVLERFCSLPNHTPERMGELLYDATMLPFDVWGRHNRTLAEKRSFARKVLFQLEEGRELVKMEERFNR